MAFDDQLAQRIRDVLAEVPDVSERRMFGGLAFMVGGHMACGIVASDLMIRLGDAGVDAALDRPHVRPMVYVAAEGIVGDRALRQWVGHAVEYVLALPPKT
jgi:hypothetical protein